MRYWAAWVLVLALLAWTSHALSARQREQRRPSIFERLLGPFASLAASAQWVRVDVALRRGEMPLAYARADTALRLDPGDAQGWIFLAHHFIYERGSLEREPDREARRRWIETGIDTLTRGEEIARDPGAIALETAAVYAFLASVDPSDRAWPGTTSSAWSQAADAFERAVRAGYPRAAEFARLARAEASRHGD